MNRLLYFKSSSGTFQGVITSLYHEREINYSYTLTGKRTEQKEILQMDTLGCLQTKEDFICFSFLITSLLLVRLNSFFFLPSKIFLNTNSSGHSICSKVSHGHSKLASKF